MEINVGDTITLKKNHPCGGKDFMVTRTGMDIKLKCLTCGHELMLSRKKAEKSITGIRKGELNV